MYIDVSALLAALILLDFLHRHIVPSSYELCQGLLGLLTFC